MKQLITGLTKLSAASILVMSLVACGGADDRKAKYLEKGKVYLAEKNYDKARIEIKNVLQIDPKYAEAYFLMGQLEEKNKELVKAMRNYQKAIELDTKFSDAKVKLAKIYVIAGTDDFIKRAKRLIDKVQTDEPDNVEAEFVNALIEYKTDSKAKAISMIENVIAKDKSQSEAVILLSMAYISEGSSEKALDVLTEGAKNNSTNIDIRVSLAKLLAKKNDILGAEKYLKQAIQIDPEEYSLRIGLASLYANSGQLEKAETVLRDAIKLDEDDAQRYLVLVEMLSSRVGVSKAEDELKKAIQQKPDLYDLKFAQVKFYENVETR